MAWVSRTFEDSMDCVEYEKLGDEPDIERTWGLLRNDVWTDAFDEEFIHVPFIESAAYYNQLFVFVKQQSFLSKIARRPPPYKIIGNMDYLVNRDISTWDPQFDFSPWDVADGHKMFSDINFRLISRDSLVEKFIEFKAVGAHIRGAKPPLPTGVTIHRNLLKDLEGVKSLYVITDVILASYMKLTVRIGNQTRNLIYDRDMPFAFRYKKYNLRNDGTFVAEMNTSLKFGNEAIWIRPLPQPVPPVPIWDQMRRRYDGEVRKKVKSHLTIPTANETSNLFRRRPAEEDPQDLRFDRRVQNNQARNFTRVNNNFILDNALIASMETLRSDNDEDD